MTDKTFNLRYFVQPYPQDLKSTDNIHLYSPDEGITIITSVKTLRSMLRDDITMITSVELDIIHAQFTSYFVSTERAISEWTELKKAFPIIPSLEDSRKSYLSSHNITIYQSRKEFISKNKTAQERWPAIKEIEDTKERKYLIQATYSDCARDMNINKEDALMKEYAEEYKAVVEKYKALPKLDLFDDTENEIFIKFIQENRTGKNRPNQVKYAAISNEAFTKISKQMKEKITAKYECIDYFQRKSYEK